MRKIWPLVICFFLFAKAIGQIVGLGNLLFYCAFALLLAHLLGITRHPKLSRRFMSIAVAAFFLSLATIPLESTYPQIATGLPSFAAIIGPYDSVEQIISGVFYDMRTIFAMLLLLPVVSEVRMLGSGRPLRVFFYLGLTQCVAAYAEYASPGLHAFLLNAFGYAKTIDYGYDSTIFFAYRGVALVGNTYEAGFFFATMAVLSLWAYRKKIESRLALITMINSFIALIVINTRSCIIFALVAIIMLFLAESRNIATRIKRLTLAAITLLSLGLLAYAVNAGFRASVDATVTMSDSTGSSQAHWSYFWAAFDIAFKHPLGIGAGRVNLSRIPYGQAFMPESFLQSILIDSGFLFLAMFLVLYRSFSRAWWKAAPTIAKPLIFSLAWATILTSLINMQILASAFVFPTIALAGVLACGASEDVFNNSRELVQRSLAGQDYSANQLT